MSIYPQLAEGLRFHLDTLAQLDRITASEDFNHIDRDTIDMMLDQAARFSAEQLEPLATEADVAGCTLANGKVSLPPGTREVYQQWCELGFPALGLPLEHDGLGFPRVAQAAIQEIGDAAHMAFGMMAINVRCAALALLKNAGAEFCQQWLPGLLSGEVAPTIVISEPQAGSDVGRIRTAATPRDDGTWSISGSKIWISFGDHDASQQILHLVLARVPGGEVGTRGLGLFAVPRDLDGNNNGVSPMRLEHKLGLHGSPTCVMEFQQAKGWLIGEAGKGIQALFVMMNAMRQAVSVQGSAVANAATLHALQYADERPQGGRPDQPPVPISQHADVRRMLLEMSARSELLRGLSLCTASHLDLAEALAANDAAQAALHQKLGELLLPVAKTVCAEEAFEVASQGIQVLGGYGYTNDYPMERLLRDIRVASIYEGTSGIQALDFVKRKVLGDPDTLQTLLGMIRADLSTSSAANPVRVPLTESLTRYESTFATLLQDAQSDKHSVDGRAYNFLRLTGVLVTAWCGLRLFAAATGDSAYQQRLRDALTLHAASLAELTSLWAARSLGPITFDLGKPIQ